MNDDQLTVYVKHRCEEIQNAAGAADWSDVELMLRELHHEIVEEREV